MGQPVDGVSVRIKRIDEELPLPTYASDGAVAFDLYARVLTVVQPRELGMIPVNVIVNVPDGYALIVALRSGTPRKKKLLSPHSVGIVDRDFCGPGDEIQVQVLNFGDEPSVIERGERIAQGLLIATHDCIWDERAMLDREESRGGFGSTG